ncbi:hypothetical protein [Belliella pelovolcani]|uniref:hypothetical protein n=1 Tax=Belliella pelovolcani TaxID=529505 RepID=UPI00391DEA44
MDKKKKTTPILDGTYEVVGLVPGPCATKFGVVDLSKIKADMAKKLVEANFPYLRKVEKVDDKPAKSEAKSK